MAEIVKYNGTGLVSTFDEASRAAKAMAQSGYFQDARDVAQAMVKVLAGSEMGFGPFASMTGIHVIKGKPSVGANLMAAKVKSNPRYDYRVRQMDDTAVVIEFFQDGESIGQSSFTAQDAKKAGTQNLDKFPRNMLFARAMSNGVRWFCPDVFEGNAVYTPDELGATVDDNGDVIDVPVVEVREIVTDPDPEHAQPHWIETASVRSKFWLYVKELGLTNEQAHDALNVEHIKDFAGDKREAMDLLQAYAAGLTGDGAPFDVETE